METKDYQKMKKEYLITIEEARQNGVLATLFLALGQDEEVYLSKKFYLALRDDIFKSTEYHTYEDETRIITIRDEIRESKIAIELIEVVNFHEKLYLIRKVKAKHLNYNFNSQKSGIGAILRFECEKNTRL